MASRYHLHYLPNESVNADCPIIWCIVLHLTDSFSCMLSRSNLRQSQHQWQCPLTNITGENGDHATALELIISRSAASLFILVMNDRFVNCCIVMLYANVTGNLVVSLQLLCLCPRTKFHMSSFSRDLRLFDEVI